MSPCACGCEQRLGLPDLSHGPTEPYPCAPMTPSLRSRQALRARPPALARVNTPKYPNFASQNGSKHTLLTPSHLPSHSEASFFVFPKNGRGERGGGGAPWGMGGLRSGHTALRGADSGVLVPICLGSDEEAGHQVPWRPRHSAAAAPAESLRTLHHPNCPQHPEHARHRQARHCSHHPACRSVQCGPRRTRRRRCSSTARRRCEAHSILP